MTRVDLRFCGRPLQTVGEERFARNVATVSTNFWQITVDCSFCGRVKMWKGEIKRTIIMEFLRGKRGRER